MIRSRSAATSIYPGKLTVANSFRIGCIGRLTADHMRGALEAVRETLAEMDVDLSPVTAASGDAL